MKRIIFISILLSIIAMTATAQSVSKAPLSPDRIITTPLPEYPGRVNQYLYNGTAAKGSNVTYICVHDRRIVTIYNTNNVYEDVTPKRSDGVPTGIDDMVEVANPATIYEIFSEVFSPSERTALEDMRRITIGYTINPSSGDVMEVNFMFLDISEWAKVPPDKFYLFEQKIKQRMKFIMTDIDRKYNIVKAMF